ncbi:MAG TPA: ATP-binding protein [Candidatus Nitrosopolaris sp.]|nr:ATP-binding protein [Candidatus Nitrosopolaris sp.]
MPYHCLVPLSAAAANLVIGALVLRQGAGERLHRVFAALTLAVVCWNLDLFALYYFRSGVEAEWWSRVFRTGVCVAPAILFHTTLLLAESHGRVWAGLLTAAYATGAVLAVANLHGDLVSRVTPHPWGWYIEPTRLYAVMTALLVVYLPLSIERIWRAYRNPVSPRQRVQAKFWFLAALVQTPFALTNLLPVYGINVYPIGSLGNVLYVGIVAYAIARHRLMDVDYVVRKGVSFCLASALVLIPGSFLHVALAREFGTHRPIALTCISVAITLLAVILVPTLQAGLDMRVHRALFRHLHDSRRRLQELAGAVVHILNPDELIRQLGDGLSEVLDLESCHIFVPRDQSRRFVSVYRHGAVEALPDDVAGDLEHVQGALLADELPVRGPAAGAFFRQQAWEVAIALRIEKRLTGVIALGRKRDFRIFSGEDLQLLDTVAANVSVALENTTLSGQLRRSEAVLERANRLSSLGALAAGIAHEIRNPLVAVKTFLDLLPERLGDRDFVTQFRDLSLGELRRVTNLINDLLSLGKSPKTERREVVVREALVPVVHLMTSTARKRQVELVTHFEPDLPTIWADPDQLKQITLNLLLNAIEVSPAGSQVNLDVQRMADPPQRVVLAVSDQGPGIPPEQRDDIFHPFFTTKETGVGLGLALVHQMVVEHEGEITVASEVGRGSVFRVTLPVGQPANHSLASTGS